MPLNPREGYKGKDSVSNWNTHRNIRPSTPKINETDWFLPSLLRNRNRKPRNADTNKKEY